MAKIAPPTDKYFLRSLHQEIDLYDRKLTHLDKYMDFATPEEKDQAKSKLLQKRSSLEKTARKLAADGVEFSDADLPRSFHEANVEGASHS